MIQVTQLCKRYDIVKKEEGLLGAVKGLFKREIVHKLAVNEIEFTIQDGECVAYIGGNGAGKSTTIKMLTGILTPTSGQVLVNGIIPYENRVENAKQIGVVFGQRTQLLWDIAVIESYELLKYIYRIPEVEFRKRLNFFVEELNLGPLLNIPVRQLSLGQRIRCEFLASFLHNPKTVYLDEPTIGLDVAVKARIRQFIKDMNEQHGTTIILTSHDMEDIEDICNRLIIIDEGKIIYDGNMNHIKKRFGQQRILHLELKHPDRFQLPAVFGSLVQVVTSDESSNTIDLSFDQERISAAEVISVMMGLYEVNDLTISEPKIETIVREILTKGM